MHCFPRVPVSVLRLVFGLASPDAVAADDLNYRFSIAQSLNTSGPPLLSAWSEGDGAIWYVENNRRVPGHPVKRLRR